MAIDEAVAAGGKPAALNPTPLNVGVPGDGVYITDPTGQTLLIKTGNTLYQTGTQDLGMRYARTLGDAEFQKANGSGAYAMELGNKYLQSLGLNYSSLPSIGGGSVADLLGNASKLGLSFSNNLDLTNLPNLLKTQQTPGTTATLNTEKPQLATPEQIAAATTAQTAQLADKQGQNVTLPPGTTGAQNQPNDITQLLSLPDLQPGAQGNEVLTLQNWLVAHGFLSATDLQTGPGIYGPKTTAAVAAWQAASGIDTAGNPGYFGPKSKAFLQQQVQSGAQTIAPGTTGTQETTGTSVTDNGTGTSDGFGDGSGVSDLADLSNQIRKLYGLPESTGTKTITQQAIEDYQSVYTALGIPTVKQAYQDAVKEFSDLQNKLNDDIADINEDPWLSESVRAARIARAKSRYETKLDTATNKMNLFKSLVDEGTAQARDILSAIHNTQSDVQNAVDNAIGIVEKQIDAQTALAKENAKENTQVVEANGRKLLIDSKTGQTVKDLGSSASGTAAPKGSVISGKLTYTPDDQAEDSTRLEASRGQDGWVDPTVFLNLYNAWVKNGGNTSDFIRQYPPKLYVNPANDWLPPILRNTSSSLSDQIDSIF